jgi:hypothetical protein
MDPDVVADRAPKKAIQIHKPLRHQRAPILRGNDQKIGTGLLSGLTDLPADVACLMEGLQLHSQIPSPLNSAVEHLIRR